MNEQLKQSKSTFETGNNKKISFRGQTESLSIYRIKIENLYYNDLNDRIATWMSEYNSKNPQLTRDDIEKYNEVIQTFIISSNEKAFNETKLNIKKLGQREPGVVLSDGRIIDGNRRFTCMRNLYRETGDPQFAYFEAIILDGDELDKDIKILELELQHGVDKIVDYDPIDKLVGVYNDVVKNKLFTVDQYRLHTNTKTGTMNTMIEKAELMVDFLESINAKDKFYIARELDIDGPLQDMVSIKRKIKDEFVWNDAKMILFDYLIAKPKGDITRLIRELGTIINSNHYEEFSRKHFSAAKSISEKLDKKETTIETIRNTIRNDDKILEQLEDNYDRHSEKIKLDLVKEKPFKALGSALSILEEVDLNVFEHLNVSDKRSTKDMISNIKKLVEKLEVAIDAK